MQSILYAYYDRSSHPYRSRENPFNAFGGQILLHITFVGSEYLAAILFQSLRTYVIIYNTKMPNVGDEIIVNDKMQHGYRYKLVKPIGEEADDFHQNGFNPDLTPPQMLKMGIFEGKYLNDCEEEFPKEWFEYKRHRDRIADPELNYLKVKSRQSLQTWRENGWIIGDDPRGWFQWYCRYYMGRRTDYDAKQISRWKSYARHRGQVQKHCEPGDLSCRPKQRQGLLQWAYGPNV